MKLSASLLGITAAIFMGGSAARGEAIMNAAGTRLTVEAAHGDFQITTKSPSWTLGGSIGKALSHVATQNGSDAIGPYQEIEFRWTQEGHREGAIRLYQRPVVLFKETFVDAVDGSPAPFPVISHLPPQLHEFRYGEYGHLARESFHLGGLKKDEPYGGPFALFDDQANTLILSPACDFMIARLSGDQREGLSSGFNSTLKSVPAGYRHETLLAIGQGINRTWEAWGNALTDLYGKKRPANDADTGLKYLGYWTDNGSAYYYNYDPAKGYAGTLLAVKDHLLGEGVAIHYMQLDSWWYPKTFRSVQASGANKPGSKNPKLPTGTWNRYGGLIEYVPHPDLFPDGMEAFHERLGLSLITHNRWIDPTSPYHAHYTISGLAAIDPAWWNKIISDIASWGVSTYEQDWNNYIYRLSPELYSTTWAGDAYMDSMAAACAAHGVTMQYCMILPRNLMQGGAKYSNLTTVRVSDDRFEPRRWREFLYGSEMAKALGVWPWTDVFRSKETPNILLATLSAGMVGLSDAIGQEDLSNISRTARADGVIVKPDVPLTPTDATFIDEAEGKSGPRLCATFSGASENGGAGKAVYLFAFHDASSKPRGGVDGGDAPQQTWSVTPASLGMQGKVFAYDYFKEDGEVIDARQSLRGTLNDEGWSYRVLIPIGPSGMALIGDAGKFVTRGRKRIAAVKDDASAISTTVLLAPGEKAIDLTIYAEGKPSVRVTNGFCSQVSYDAGAKLARAEIVPAASAQRSRVAGDPVISLQVTIQRAR